MDVSNRISTPSPYANLTVGQTEYLPAVEGNRVEMASSHGPEAIMVHICKLRDRLHVLQCRLGTPLETCADLQEARTITHTMRNYVQMRRLWKECGYGHLDGWRVLMEGPLAEKRRLA